MKALVFQSKNAPLQLRDIELPGPGSDQVRIPVVSAALNHRDNWITKGMYPGLRADIVLGSDACAEFEGREVLINPSNNWGDNPRYPAADYTILGMPNHGTFSEEIVVARNRIVDKPAHLDRFQAAALPLAGVTAYRVLFTRCRLQPGEKVLISGIGGGVALFAYQFAMAAGAEVWVTSGSNEKITRAVETGAAGGANYRQNDWAKDLKKQTGGFDVIIDSAGGEGFADLVKLTKRGARIGLYGGTVGNWQNISPQIVFFNQIDILGSTMGSDQDFVDMVDFVSEKKVVPIVDSVYPLADGNTALQHMDQGEQYGKIVLDVSG